MTRGRFFPSAGALSTLSAWPASAAHERNTDNARQADRRAPTNAAPGVAGASLAQLSGCGGGGGSPMMGQVDTTAPVDPAAGAAPERSLPIVQLDPGEWRTAAADGNSH